MIARLGDLLAATSTASGTATATPSATNALEDATRACRDGAVVCSNVREWTGSYQVGLWTQTLVDGGLRIFGIIVLGWLLRVLFSRLIKEFERRAISSDGGPLTGLSRKITGVLDTDTVSTVRRIQRIKSASSVIRNVSTVVIWSAVLLMVLSEVGLNIAPLLASAGIIGVAIGFGAQSLVKDFLTGLFMMLEDQYGVGDRVDFGDAKGTVVAVGMRVTRVRADDSTMWYVPNGSILRVGNLGQGWGRAIVDVETSEPSQLAAVEDILNEAAERLSMNDEWMDDVARAANTVTIEPLAFESSTLRIVMKTRTGRQWVFRRALQDAVMAAAMRRGVALEEVEAAAPVVVMTDPPSTTLAAPPAPGALDAASVRLRVVSMEPSGDAADDPAHQQDSPETGQSSDHVTTAGQPATGSRRAGSARSSRTHLGLAAHRRWRR